MFTNTMYSFLCNRSCQIKNCGQNTIEESQYLRIKVKEVDRDIISIRIISSIMAVEVDSILDEEADRECISILVNLITSRFE